MANQCIEYQQSLEKTIEQSINEFESELALIQDEVQNEADELKEETPEGIEVALGFDLEVGSREEVWKLHLPQFILEEQQVGSWDIPEIFIEQQDIIFHTPSVRMVMKVVGKYPEVKCGWRGCRTTWKEIKTKVPETFMEEQKIRMGVPVVRTKHQNIILSIPVVEFKLTELKFNVPTIEIEDVSGRISETKREAKKLQSETEKRIEKEKVLFKTEYLQRLEPVHTSLYDCLRQNILTQQDIQVSMLESGIKTVDSKIKQLQDLKVPANDEHYKELELRKSKLLKGLKKVVAEFEKILLSFDETQQYSWTEIVNSFS